MITVQRLKREAVLALAAARVLRRKGLRSLAHDQLNRAMAATTSALYLHR